MDNKIKDLLQFIDESPSPFHAAKASLNKLSSKNIILLDEKKPFVLELGNTYAVERSLSSVILFSIPKVPIKNYQLRIIGAHTDSPSLMLKPKAKSKFQNYDCWGTQPYGGTLFNSWLNCDLKLAGKVSFKLDDQYYNELITLKKVFKIPQLCIHLDRAVNREGLKLNPHKHLNAIFGLSDKADDTSINKKITSLILEELNLDLKKQPKYIDFELYFSDVQSSNTGGINDEFIFAPRLDNLSMCHAATLALQEYNFETDFIPMVALFDHEEVGSTSNRGAASNFLKNTLEKISISLNLSRDQFLSGLSSSLFISADTAHALHPNYIERHDPEHAPLLDKGMVIKSNANLAYATQIETIHFIREKASHANVDLQNFINRVDLGCGSTIGPFVASALGMKTIDIGPPILSMHATREMASCKDHLQAIKLFKEIFRA